jgi:hypothetical protein
MWEWCDKLKLGKASAFVKRDIRPLPLTDAEFEADFFLDSEHSTKRQELWMGMVVERESGGLLATEDVRLPPPTVNHLAALLSQAMKWPPRYEDRQRPTTIYLRDRPQWRELLPHLEQLEIKVVLGQDLPWLDEAAIEWLQKVKTGKPPSADEIKVALRKPFPERIRTSFDDAMALMEWSDTMFKAVYPTGKDAVPLHDPEKPISLRLTADELEAILTQTEIVKTKKLRPRMEAMAAEGKAIDLAIIDWSRIISALCAPKVKADSARRRLLTMATTIAIQLAKTLGIEPPADNKQRSRIE